MASRTTEKLDESNLMHCSRHQWCRIDSSEQWYLLILNDPSVYEQKLEKWVPPVTIGIRMSGSLRVLAWFETLVSGVNCSRLSRSYFERTNYFLKRVAGGPK